LRGEFLECVVPAFRGESYFLHLPSNSCDVIDFEKSQFLFTIPGTPPIPHRILKLVIRDPSLNLPPCLRASMPSTVQVSAECLVTEQFMSAWKAVSFTGAEFRTLA